MEQDFILIKNGVVQNVIRASSDFISTISSQYDFAIARTSGMLVGPGDLYDGVNFTHISPVVTPDPDSPYTPNRASGAVFQPSLTKGTMVFYTVQISCASDQTGPQAGKIELFCDAQNPPQTIVARFAHKASFTNSGLATFTDLSINEGTLCYLVPPGHFIKIVATQIQGTPSLTLTGQREVTLGQ